MYIDKYFIIHVFTYRFNFLIHTSDPLQPDYCEQSVLIKFRINSTPIWRLGNVASMEASIDYMAIRI